MRVPRFGPAGKPLKYKGKIEGIPKYLRERGLDAFEYQAVYGVKIKEEDAKKLGEEARKYNVKLSIHAPYYINLCSTEQEKLEKSIERVVSSVQAAVWMGAELVVFHPGAYKGLDPSKAFEIFIKSLKEIEDKISVFKEKILLGAETMGKKNQFGSLDEIIKASQEIDILVPVIDWAHLHARDVGALNEPRDFIIVLERIENELGTDVAKNLHCHFTRVEYTQAGERRHHIMSEEDFGPEFRDLAEAIAETGFISTIISESPLLDEDALVMKQILIDVLREKGLLRHS
ncbi:MAG: deoxyribonuclease IV [Thermoprotei archaeon]|nr:MAG: deoxyribonuclease IV [Thermoprotei archaeon]RLF00939.1 MAG: deoxyribonuclease IV [Thermoprotei archaeon]HDI75392.1 deoxyribonuclease IV [Thermoprotei archaeon]